MFPRPNKLKAPYATLLAIPKEELYRLIVDGRFGGWWDYENRQPGCLEAAFAGLAYVITQLKNPLTVQQIAAIHHACTANVANLDQQSTSELRSQRSHIEGHVIRAETATLEGVVDLLEMIESQAAFGEYSACLAKGCAPDQIDPLTAIHHDSINAIRLHYGVSTNAELADKLLPDIKAGQYVYRAPCLASEEAFTEQMQYLLQQYHKQIKEAANTRERKNAIVNLVYEMEHLHPYFDANTRTFTVCVLAGELLKNGLDMAVFMNPNLFCSAYSRAQLATLVDEGMQEVRALAQKKKFVHGYSTDEFYEKHKDSDYSELYEKIISPFVSVRAEQAVKLGVSKVVSEECKVRWAMRK